MALDGEQHVGEAADDMRADRLALERAGEAAHEGADRRDGEMIAPELRHPLGKRRVALGRGGGPRGDFGEINGTHPLVELLAVGRVLLVAHHLELLGEHHRRRGQAAGERLRLHHLPRDPAARIGRDRVELARPRREAEAGLGDEGTRRRRHGSRYVRHPRAIPFHGRLTSRI